MPDNKIVDNPAEEMLMPLPEGWQQQEQGWPYSQHAQRHSNADADAMPDMQFAAQLERNGSVPRDSLPAGIPSRQQAAGVSVGSLYAWGQPQSQQHSQGLSTMSGVSSFTNLAAASAAAGMPVASVSQQGGTDLEQVVVEVAPASAESRSSNAIGSQPMVTGSSGSGRQSQERDSQG